MHRYFRIAVVILAGLTVLWGCTEEPSAGKEAVAKKYQEAMKGPDEGTAEKAAAAYEEIMGRHKDNVVDHPSKLKFPELKFDPPRASDYRVKLENGMRIYIAPDKELPTFDMQVIVRTGSMYESKDGLAAMCGELMRKGGTTSMSGEEIDDYMAQFAGSLTTTIGFSSGSASLSVLKEDTDRGLKMLADVLMNPIFAEDEIRRYKEKTLQNLEHRYDRPGTLLSDVYSSLLYESHPAGSLPSKSAIKSITREDLLLFHEEDFHPNNCIVAVAGDFDRDEMIKKIEKLFTDWDEAEIEFPEIPDEEAEFERGVFLLEKDINQGYVRMGHLGIRDDNPDVYAVRIMNAILGGGGFTSRIMSRVRSDEGLAYSVYSWFDTPVEYTGTFSCSFQTKSGSVAYAVSLVMEEIKRIRSEPVTEEELQQAKDQFIERFPSIFSGMGSAAYARVQVLARNEYNRHPLDYYDHYRDNYAKVTREQVLEVAKKYLKPDGLKIVVVGKTDEIKSGDGEHEVALKDFGEVKLLKPPALMK